MDWSNLPIKKIALAALFTVVVVAAGFGIYYLFFRAPAEVVPEEEVVTPPGGLPGVPAEGLPGEVVEVPGEVALPGIAELPESVTKIEAPVSDISTVARGGITQVTTTFAQPLRDMAVPEGQNNPVLYDRVDGYFYSVNTFGTRTRLSDQRYPNVEDISWSPNADKAILEFPDGTNVLYDFRANKQVSLPKSWQDFEFNDQGTKIAFKDINFNLDYNWLAISDPDGSKQKYIEPIADKGDRIEVNWSKSGHVVATYNKAANSTTTQIHLIGQYGENYRAIDAKGFGVQSKWVPDGRRMIYHGYSIDTDNKPMLYIVDAYGDRVGYNNNALNLNTWIDKCTFEGESTMYCAVPKYLPDNAGFQPTIADEIPDYIYKVDLASGAKSIIAEPELSYTIDSMEVSSDGQYLYFTDKATGGMHYIQLK